MEQAQAAFSTAQSAHAVSEIERQRKLTAKRAEHSVRVQRENDAANRHNAEIAVLAAQAQERKKEFVEKYLLHMAALTPLPKDFPREMQVAFDPTAEHAVLECELPRPDCVPAVKSVRYVQARDEISEGQRPPREKAELYRGVVAQLCLLTVRTVFNSDPALRQISFNGRVRHVNPATGHEERPHIISVVVARDEFESLVLDRVRPDECLRHLKALVSPHPFELEAVEPLVEFDRSRLAFIEGLGVVSGLDARPDLMAMTPAEFEHLISELLEADPSIDSVESLTTRQSNDGGVDGVIYIKQPFGRSMTVVQVKQYARNRNLGPAHVRELIGAMHEVRAGNGLLVTTSDFTATARANAAEFGRISLIDGNNLVHMIKKLLEKDVLIGDRRK
jgi:restriction system protein